MPKERFSMIILTGFFSGLWWAEYEDESPITASGETEDEAVNNLLKLLRPTLHEPDEGVSAGGKDLVA